MTPERFAAIIGRYRRLTLAVVGDFSLDRYLEIDPALAETSIETGLDVHNVVNVRSQPGAAGTILNNLCALGVGRIHPVGFCGEDGEGFELLRALRAKPAVKAKGFLQTSQRCTFTYCKPLVMAAGRAPRELNRLDRKNWSPTPSAVQDRLIDALYAIADDVDSIIVMDQVDVAETGVVTTAVLEAVHTVSRKRRALPILADSRRGLASYPPLIFKMNAAELKALTRSRARILWASAQRQAAELAAKNGRDVIVTMAEHGMCGATPAGETVHLPAWPVRGEIDVVGAGDAVTANLAAALAAGATLREAMELANAAASIVIHQLGTTGTAGVEQLAGRITGTTPRDDGGGVRAGSVLSG